MNQFIQIKIDNFTNYISNAIYLSNMNINNTTSIFNYIKKKYKMQWILFSIIFRKK